MVFYQYGFAGPFDAFGTEEAVQLRHKLSAFEARVGGSISGEWRFQTHLFLPWVDQVDDCA
jgi:hypothetical protein